MGLLASVKNGVYRLHQNAWSKWARRRYASDFGRVESFVLFVGYPRSGHSLVGAVLNAHRDAVISHELDAPPLILAGCSRDELYARILARANWFNLRGNTSNYEYYVPHQWQGRFTTLRVIGDKRGGAVTRCIAAHPEFLTRVRDLVRVPLRLVHVVRNPFDNISAISIWHQMTLEESIDFYFSHCDTTLMLPDQCLPEELVMLRHEDLLREPRSVLSGLCSTLGLEGYPGYLEDCCGVLFRTPTYTRRRLAWSAPLVRDVERRMRGIPFLAQYGFEITEEETR